MLAYSTISQLAYMIAGMSMGPAGRTGAFFHLFTHAFFKALLFLGSGAVIHAVHSNNMSEMGGLRRHLPITFWTFLIGSLALSGVPPLAGFWSKDELLVVAEHEGHPVLFVVLLVTALLTAFYMTRAVLMTFYGEYRGHGEPHEAPRSMTGVLVALASVTVVRGPRSGRRSSGRCSGSGSTSRSSRRPCSCRGSPSCPRSPRAGGIIIGYALYRDYQERDPLRSLGGAYALVSNKFYLDDIYWKGIVRPIRDDVSAGVYWNDRHIIDGVVNGAAAFTKTFASGVSWFDLKVIDGAVNGLANIAGFTGGLLRYIQSGNVQRYAVFLFAGVVVLAIIFTRI